ncbi:unnamed protein product [Protopolystoma xenopodis]|uniref:Uncharacterized protein n=1 Tax=Protopolystoma xenopodis TaxID=117903 RepID=A0A448XAJ2_9PLAT|nr:unnamed protein product [Protopolystoma xenopodis]
MRYRSSTPGPLVRPPSEGVEWPSRSSAKAQACAHLNNKGVTTILRVLTPQIIPSAQRQLVSEAVWMAESTMRIVSMKLVYWAFWCKREKEREQVTAETDQSAYNLSLGQSWHKACPRRRGQGDALNERPLLNGINGNQMELGLPKHSQHGS